MNLVNALFKRCGIGRYCPFLIICLLLTSWSSINLKAQECERTEFRTIDGTCNNIRTYSQKWGSANISIDRASGYEYAETNRYNDMVTDRPNPRYLSNALFAQDAANPNTKGLSSFVYVWGQFLDHDIGISPTDATDKASISLPPDEPIFTNDISFSRSKVSPFTGSYNARRPINLLTSWIDGSQVYGSDVERAHWLRTFNNGQLKVSSGNLLPYNTIDGEAGSTTDPLAPDMDNLDRGASPHFVAGDVRASEQPGLTALHVIFLREHNRICEELINQGYVEDELIYQTARKQVAGLIQAITFNEFLPALGINLRKHDGYNPYIRPDAMNAFTTAAFRIGHTMVAEEFILLDDDCNAVRDNLSLEEAFFNPRWIAQLGVEPFLKGFSTQLQEKIDGKIIDGLRNFLFAIPQLPGTFGLDLASINIQRGRDHGLKDYASIRHYFTGTRINEFNQINSDPTIWKPIAEAYNYDINKVDPWVGMLNETPVYGSAVGTSIYFILKSQFEELRDGDYYYYKNDPYLSQSEVRTIDGTSLADVIQRNADLSSLQAQVFYTKDSDNCEPEEDLASIECNGTTIEYGSDKINIIGQNGSTYHYQIFNKAWQRIDGCGWNCGTLFQLNDLKPDQYRIYVYSETWSVLCSEVVTVGSTGGLIDKDGDGIVADKDCNDADPTISLIGAPCNDNNSNTTNDLVDTNCQCKGTPINTQEITVTCNGVDITYGNGEISIIGAVGKNYMIKVDQVVPGWTSIENCVGSCGSTKMYSNLSNGDYLVRIWSDRWEPMCNEEFSLGNGLVQEESTRAKTIISSKVVDSKLYPNPGSDRVFLTLPNFVGLESTILLYNNLGQVIQELPNRVVDGSPIMLSVSNFPSGIYYIQAIAEGKDKINHKLIIE